jgi:hypothetical protein
MEFDMRGLLAWRAVAVAIIVAAGSGSALAQTAAAPTPSLDILGLRTGMREAELRSALGKAGFVEQDTSFATKQFSPTTHSNRLILNNFKETEFLSSLVAQKFGGTGGTMLDDIVLIAFLPYGNEPRAWAIRRTVRYQPAGAPSYKTTLTAVSEKYGTEASVLPNNTIHWWWDASGKPLPPKSRLECERAIHDTQMYPDNRGTSTKNLAAVRAPAFPAISKSECAYGIRVQMDLDANRNVARLDVLAVALKDANAASLATSKIVTDLAKAAQAKANAAADSRKPDL